MKVKKSVRLDENTWSELEKLSKEKEISQTELIEKAIHDAIHVPPTMPPTCHPRATQDDTDWKTLYFEEKKRNDEMADRILGLSAKVADVFQAEKVIEAKDAVTTMLESQEQKTERKSWWKRVKASLVG